MMEAAACAFFVVYAPCAWLFGLPGLWKLIGIPAGLIIGVGLGAFLLPVLLANLLGFTILDMMFPVVSSALAAIITAGIMSIVRHKKTARP